MNDENINTLIDLRASMATLDLPKNISPPNERPRMLK